MNRTQKLNKLTDKARAKEDKLALDNKYFLKQFTETVDIFKATFEGGVEINGLDKLLNAIEDINKSDVIVDLKPIEQVSKKLDKLTKAVNDSKAPTQGQKPTDFVPMRRVVYVSGRTPIFDD